MNYYAVCRMTSGEDFQTYIYCRNESEVRNLLKGHMVQAIKLEGAMTKWHTIHHIMCHQIVHFQIIKDS